MLLPYRHDSDTVRRIPWVSFSIIALCFIIFLYTSSEMGKYENKFKNIESEVQEYCLDHPYLKVDPEIEDNLFSRKYGEEFKALHETFAEQSGSKPTDPDVLEAQQEELDALTQQYYNTKKEVPYYRWGYIPREKSYGKLFTYMFIHGDWIHLIFNLLFFYVLGPFIEDAWGKSMYTVFYLLMGVLAAIFSAMHYPNSQGPMMGASGAIAGIMGAFFIRFWNTRIKFFYMFSLSARGTFEAPAWVMLPLWLVNAFFNAQYMDSIAAQSSGVAHWTHLWGFVLGAVFAVVVKMTGIEEKFIAPKIEAQTSFMDKNFAIYQQAVMLIDTGKKDEAYAMLKDAVREDPSFQENVETLWNLSLEMGKEHEASRSLIKLIEKEVRHNQLDLALYHFAQLRTKIPDASVSPHSKVMFIEALADKGEYKEAGQITDELFKEINLSSPPGLLLNFCSAVLKLDLSNPKGDLSLTERTIGLALRHPDIPENKKEELRATLQNAPKMKEDGGRAEQGAVYTPEPADTIPITRDQEVTPKKETIKIDPVGFAAGTGTAAFHREPGKASMRVEKEEVPLLILPKNIKVTKAVPTAVKGKEMTLHVEGAGQKIILLDKIQVISVVKISSPAESPYLLLDLFVDDPEGDSIDVRTIRFLSRTFNPQKFVPSAQNPLEAFKVFTSALLKLSGAKPFPDLESVQLVKIKVFPSIKEYEDSIG